MSWKDTYRAASFRGVGFKVSDANKAGGRRGQTYEYPKSDTIDDEDLGRRATRWNITGYVIGPLYHLQADALEAVLGQEGGGLLIHPTMREMIVRCEVWNRIETKDQGGMATFNMSFVEANQGNSSSYSENTEAEANDAAYSAQVDAVSAAKNDPSVKAGPR